MSKEKQILFTLLFYIVSWYLIMVAIYPLKLNPQLALQGLVSYISLGLTISLLASLSPAFIRWSLYLLTLFFFILNTEHIYINFAHINLAFSHLATNNELTLTVIFNDQVFRLLLYNATLFFACITASTFIKKVILKKSILALSLLITSLSTGLTSFSHPIYPNWYLQNPLAFQVENLIKKLPVRKVKKDINKNSYINMESTSSISLSKPNKINNIILVILEGFSQRHLEQGLAPFLGTLSTKALAIPYFINNQTQTNRGLYSLLCGDYPNLVNFEAKSDILIANDNLQHCFPHFLHRKGFTNYFTQSAPLSYMSKDLFAKASGFDFAIGAKSFPEQFLISKWGIADNALFASILKILDQNREQKKFISTLTVGTHHPYTTPVSTGSLKKAITYTDQILASFYLSLLKRNFFEDGLLIITSDETKPTKEPTNPIYHNQGLMLLLANGISPYKHLNIFSQIDLSETIKDLFEEPNKKNRSFFEKYSNDERDIYFSHAFRNRVSAIHNQKEFTVCDKSFTCMTSSSTNSIFNSEVSFSPSDNATISKMKSFTAKSDRSFIDSNILFKREHLSFSKSTRMPLFSDLKTTAQTNTSLKVELEYKYVNKGYKASKMIWNYYPCFKADQLSKQEFEIPFNSLDVVHELILPEYLISKNICHSIEVINNADLSIEKVELRR